MALHVTPSMVIAEPRLLAPGFSGASWDRWRATLKAMFGEALDNRECRLFREVAERAPPTRPVKEAWLLVGRRGGKDSIAAAIAVTMALTDHRKHLRPGEVGVIACLAVTKEQANIVLKYIKASFLENQYLAPLVTQETADGIEIASNGVEIIVLANRFRSLRGRTVLCAIFDECAYWRSEDSTDPDQETYAAIVPAMITLPDSMLIAITTVYRKAGLAYDKWAKYYGRNDPDTLVIKATSRQYNPLIDQKFIDEQIELDPEVNSAEYLSEWRRDIVAYVSREAIEAAVIPGRYQLWPQPSVQYAAFIDPSGGAGSDSMTLAVGHNDGELGERRILDAVYEWQPPFSPSQVTAEAAKALSLYGITAVKGDKYGGDWVAEAFRAHQIEYEPAEKPKTGLYQEALPLFNSGMVELLDNKKLVSRLCGLERRSVRGSGRDAIDHPLNGHDDLANVTAGCLTLAGIERSLLAWRGML
jgi:hypothetical protein